MSEKPVRDDFEIEQIRASITKMIEETLKIRQERIVYPWVVAAGVGGAIATLAIAFDRIISG